MLFFEYMEQPKTQSDLKADLAAVLDRFGGDSEKAAQALNELARERERAGRAKRKYGPVIVQITNGSRNYRLGKERVAAVHEVSLEVKQGEFVAITGPSGSGKSTLLNMIGGLDRPDSGQVLVDGHDLAKLGDSKLSEFRGRTVGFVFQFFYLQPFLSVRSNLTVPGMFAHLPRADRVARVEELAEAVGIADRLDHLPKELSGGQMQRAAIARALLNRPKIVLADEPTGNVDRANAYAIIKLFDAMRDRYSTTIIMVTHDAEVANMADRRVALRDGRIV